MYIIEYNYFFNIIFVTISCIKCIKCITIQLYVIVIARVLGIYGSKPTRVRGRSPRTRAVYVAINP